MGEDLVFDRVKRRKAYVTAFSCLHPVVSPVSEYMGHTKSGSRSDHTDGTLVRQRDIGSAKMLEACLFNLSNGMADSFEIIDQAEGLNAQLLANQRWTNDPWIVREVDDVGLHQRGNSNCSRSR